MLKRIMAGFGLAAALAAAPLAAAWAADSVKVGLILSMTGKYSAYGQEMNAGFQQVVDEINAAGGIKSMAGAQIEVVLMDDTSEPSVAALSARKLILDEEVSMLAGFPITALINAVGAVADQSDALMFSFAGGRQGIAKHFFTMVFEFGPGYAENMVAFLDDTNRAQNLGIRDVVVASSDSEPGKGIDRELEARLTERGYNVVGVEPIPSDRADLTPTLLKIRSLDPDAVVSFIYAADGIKFNNARFTLGYHDPLWVGGTAGYTDPGLWDKLGDEVAAATIGTNLGGLTGYSPSEKLAAANALIERARARGVTIPLGFNFVVAAQSAQIIAEALEKAGNDDVQALEEALSTLVIPVGDPRLYLPKQEGIAFNEGGTLKDQTGLIVQWDAGKQVVVWPEAYADRAPAVTKKSDN